MATNTLKLSKAIGLTDYFDTFTNSSDYASWNWKQLCSVKKTNRLTEQIFSYNLSPIPTLWNQSSFLNYGEMSENDATTFTIVKYGAGMKFTYEVLKFSRHINDLLGKAGKDMGAKHAYIRDLLVSEFFNDITTATAWDAVAYAGTHTMKDGTSIDNALTAASLDYDNLWSSINHFTTSLYDHTGARKILTPKYIHTASVNRKTLDKILTATGEPDSGADSTNNPNLLKGKLVPIYDPFYSSTTGYTVMSDDVAENLIMFEADSPRFDAEDDFEMHGSKIRSWQMISAPKSRDFLPFCHNPGA